MAFGSELRDAHALGDFYRDPNRCRSFGGFAYADFLRVFYRKITNGDVHANMEEKDADLHNQPDSQARTI
jgi:hypothetical protein